VISGCPESASIPGALEPGLEPGTSAPEPRLHDRGHDGADRRQDDQHEDELREREAEHRSTLPRPPHHEQDAEQEGHPYETDDEK
jgi:hypothetical protein